MVVAVSRSPSVDIVQLHLYLIRLPTVQRLLASLSDPPPGAVRFLNPPSSVYTPALSHALFPWLHHSKKQPESCVNKDGNLDGLLIVAMATDMTLPSKEARPGQLWVGVSGQ